MSYLVTKFAPKVEGEWLVTVCGASPDRPASLQGMLTPLQSIFLDHIVNVIRVQVIDRVSQGQAQIIWDAPETDSKASLNTSGFVKALAQYFTHDVFVSLGRLEADRCGLKSSEVDRHRKEIETRVFSEMSAQIGLLFDAPSKITVAGFSAVLRDVGAVIESLHTHSKLRTLKLKECFAPVAQVCKLLSEPGEIEKAASSEHREANYNGIPHEFLVNTLLKYEAGCPTQMIGKTDQEKAVDRLLKAVGARK